tara:strand:+ start:2983 stop:3291 length:309 start_codon:yes stop_codon:yes gene_type:complete
MALNLHCAGILSQSSSIARSDRNGGERKLITFLVRELAADDAVGEADQHWGQSAGAHLVQFFQLAEVAVSRRLFTAILDRILRLAILSPPRGTCGVKLQWIN